MGSPFPSPVASPEITVHVNGVPHRVRLTDTIALYSARAASRPGEPIVVRIDAPTWSRYGEPAAQGVRVDRVSVRPAR
jgi:hypothetical protein